MYAFSLHAICAKRAADRRRLGHPLTHRAEVDSTNALARSLAESGATDGSLVVADRQTAGRGRRGRTWSSPEGGNVYLSLVLRPNLSADHAFEFTLLTAVALSEALEKCGASSAIKWPNDVEVDGRKVAGILSELATNPDGTIRYVILGVGVNVNVPPDALPDDVRARATSLQSALGHTVPPQQVIEALLDRLEHWLYRHATEGFAPILETWRHRSSTLGSFVRAQVDGRAIDGVAQDVDETGALLVSQADGTVERIVAGEVITLRRQT